MGRTWGWGLPRYKALYIGPRLRPAVYHTLNVREVDHVIWGIGTIYILYVAKEIRS